MNRFSTIFIFITALSLVTFSTSVFARKQAESIESISVIGDSSTGKMSKNLKMAYQLGQLMAQQKKEIVLNGQTAGLTGAVMKGAYEAGGEITALALEAEFANLCPEKHFCRQLEYIYADSPADKTMLLKDLGDVIVILPGGWEPLSFFSEIAHEQASAKTAVNEELKELKKDVAIGKKPVTDLTRAQLTPPAVKPVIFLNINHYWDNLRYLIDEMRRQKVLSEEEASFIGFAEKPKDILPMAQKMLKK